MSRRRPEDSSNGPGLTPIDSASPSSPTDSRTEPDRTTGRIPAHGDEGDAALRDKNKKAGEHNR